ncbi:MAG: circadian clock KaiB family protein [Nitrospira sp.]|nr:circadian clock KaiB family protein [Nitrospira sp.]
MKRQRDTTKKFEETPAQPPESDRYVLRLYVTGMAQRSTEAVAGSKSICEEYLDGRYDLQAIDIYQHPHLAKDERIIAAPTLVKKLPVSLRHVIGNRSGKDRVSLGLDLRLKT